jgi:lysophospholipase L1-like esterase
VDAGVSDAASEAVPAAVLPSEAGPDVAAATADPLPLPEGTKVLHIGDSMAGALGIALNEELKKRNVKGVLRYKEATFIPTWAWGKELPVYMLEHKPDLVVITLGTNEVKMADPSVRAPTIKKIIERLGGKPCVWIAPPLWAGETEMYRVLRESVAPCRYMDTQKVYPDMPRVDDKIHPSMNARKEWAKRVVDWLARERRPTPDQPWALAPEP